MASIAGVGCCVVDYLYTNVDFSSETFKRFQSKKAGDGGVNPGHLSFVDAWEKFAGMPLSEIGKVQGWDRVPDKINLGGPCIVALVNAAQLVTQNEKVVSYFGGIGKDKTGEHILTILRKTPVDITHYVHVDGPSPFCLCLSDPKYDNGHGERCFAIQLGTMAMIDERILGDAFFESRILYFGATALCPKIHDNLTSLLRRGKEKKRINIVGTVFDHRNQARNPNGRWPMGESDESFALMDLLMMDWDEAMHISGKQAFNEVIRFFQDSGVKSFTITHGAEDAYAWSNGGFFKPLPLTPFPICRKVSEEIRANPSLMGDTTGCGDNFCGGMLAYISEALDKGLQPGSLNMTTAMSWSMTSGAFALFSVGGTYIEKHPGEKRRRIEAYRQTYLDQIHATAKL